ncbi:MAG: DUF2586 family protein [Marinifilaceae bacterium]|jgi:hypothetical protein|nr:DUF2586 family protein [Marinifilaceae bacterium]
MSGVDIKKGTIGANASGSADSTSGLIATCVSVSAKLEYGKLYTIGNLKMAEDLGITSEYDKTNKVRLYYHIKEFYRMAGDGTELHLMIAEQSKTMSELLTDVNLAQKLINDADGQIKQLAVSINPANGYTDTAVDGLNSEVRAAIAKAQEFSNWCFNHYRPLNILLEGRDYVGNAGSVLDLKAIPDTPAEKVSVVIGQDWNYAEKLDDIGKKHAAVGTALGCVAKCKINQNIGENESMNITDSGKDAFMIGGLSSHQQIKDVEHEWSTLDGKHYIFPIREIGLVGLRWNNDHTCVEASIDSESYVNEHTISLGRTLDKAARLLRIQLLPKVKTVQKLDPKTGKLTLGTVKYFEGIGDIAFELMENAGEISEGKTSIDSNSDLLSGEKALIASFTVVPYGTINKISGTINLKNKL